MLSEQVLGSHLALHEAQQQERLFARQQARLRQASIDVGRLHFHELVAQQLANHSKRPKLLADAHARISQWEQDGLCWSGYVVAWKSILAMPLPQLRSAILAADGEGPALRQNSPFFGQSIQA